jgi:hypothetical protein
VNEEAAFGGPLGEPNHAILEHSQEQCRVCKPQPTAVFSYERNTTLKEGEPGKGGNGTK